VRKEARLRRFGRFDCLSFRPFVCMFVLSVVSTWSDPVAFVNRRTLPIYLCVPILTVDCSSYYYWMLSYYDEVLCDMRGVVGSFEGTLKP
jgi:hypothetical protein